MKKKMYFLSVLLVTLLFAAAGCGSSVSVSEENDFADADTDVSDAEGEVMEDGVALFVGEGHAVECNHRITSQAGRQAARTG